MERIFDGDLNWMKVAVIAVLLISCCVGCYRGFIKEIVSIGFVVLALILVSFLNPYVKDFLMEDTPVYEILQEKCQEGISEYLLEGEEGQGKLADTLPLPEVLKEEMIGHNNEEAYQLFAVDSFAGYIAGYVARMIVNGISFLLSYLAATLFIRIVVQTLDLIAKLPVLRGLNRFAGIFAGALRGLVLVWLAFLIITICFHTEWGRDCIALIEADPFLAFLYEKNVFVDVYMSIFMGK